MLVQREEFECEQSGCALAEWIAKKLLSHSQAHPHTQRNREQTNLMNAWREEEITCVACKAQFVLQARCGGVIVGKTGQFHRAPL